MSNNEVLKFQKECFANYIDDIRIDVPEIPNPYIYPDGNPIRPVIPTKTFQNSIMLIGAFPSARFENRIVTLPSVRFENRNRLLIPTGDNLSPFGHKEYFDGAKVRTQASRDSLDKYYFSQLGIDTDKIWITDIVKIYLYPEKHIKNCKVIAPDIKFVDTHKLFSRIANASLKWIKKEIQVCNPKLIITLGEVAARTISCDKKTSSEILLNGKVRPLKLDTTYKIAHLGHPEIRRRNKNWDSITEKAIKRLSNEIHIR